MAQDSRFAPTCRNGWSGCSSTKPSLALRSPKPLISLYGRPAALPQGYFIAMMCLIRPSTNNDLEQSFGSVRYHERRTTGRKAVVPAVVVRGSARLTATVASKTRLFSAQDLRPRDPHQWRQLRQELRSREQTRCQQRRFRRDPLAYLTTIEVRLLVSEAAPP